MNIRFLLELLVGTLVIIVLGAVIMIVGMLLLNIVGLGNLSLPLGVTGAIIYSAGLAMWKMLAGVGSKVKRAQRAVDLLLTPFAVAFGVFLANMFWPALNAAYVPTPPDQAFWASFAVSAGAAIAYVLDTIGNGFKQAQPREPRYDRRRRA